MTDIDLIAIIWLLWTVAILLLVFAYITFYNHVESLSFYLSRQTATTNIFGIFVTFVMVLALSASITAITLM